MTIRENIAKQLVESAETKKEMVELCLSDIEKAAELMIGAVRKKKKIFWCGNGENAAQCQSEFQVKIHNASRKDTFPEVISFVSWWKIQSDEMNFDLSCYGYIS